MNSQIRGSSCFDENQPYNTSFDTCGPAWLSSILSVVPSKCQIPVKRRTMNNYEIRVEGHLDLQWSEWLDGLTISHDGEGNSVLRGRIVDQAALHGVLMKIR